MDAQSPFREERPVLRRLGIRHAGHVHTPTKCTHPQNFSIESLKRPRMATTDPIEEALAALALQKSPNCKRTAKEYGVTRTVLSRRHRELCRSIHKAREYQRLLSTQQEATLINHINKLSKARILPTPLMVRVFTFEIS
jgi:hypothetical protein